MLKNIFFIFLLIFVTNSFAFAETIQVGKISLNLLMPTGYTDETNELDQSTIKVLEQDRMKFLKRYYKNDSNINLEHYIHIFINNELMQKVHLQTEKDLEKFLKQVDEQVSKVMNKKLDVLIKKGNEIYSEMQLNMKIDQPIVINTEKGDKYISSIVLMKMVNNKNEFLYYSLFDSEVIYICNTFFSMYSYCNFLNFNDLHKRVQEVKEQSKIFRTMLFDNNQNEWQEDNSSTNNDSLRLKHNDDNKSILFIGAVLIVILGLFLTRFLSNRGNDQQKRKSKIDLDK